MTARQKSEPRIAVQRGEVYRVARDGLPARHVRVVGISQDDPREPPVAKLVEVTRSGQRKGRKRIVVARHLDGTPKDTRPNHTPHWLTWNPARNAWVMGQAYTLKD